MCTPTPEGYPARYRTLGPPHFGSILSNSESGFLLPVPIALLKKNREGYLLSVFTPVQDDQAGHYT